MGVDLDHLQAAANPKYIHHLYIVLAERRVGHSHACQKVLEHFDHRCCGGFPARSGFRSRFLSLIIFGVSFRAAWIWNLSDAAVLLSLIMIGVLPQCIAGAVSVGGAIEFE